MCARLVLLLLAILSVTAQPALADESPAPDAAAREPVDFMPRVLAYQDEMRALGEPPLDEGPGGVLLKAWRKDLKSRSKRLVSKSKQLERESLWVFDEATGGAVAIQPKQWGTTVRRIASLYTELGTGHKNYGKERVSPDYAIRVWNKNNPEPRLTGLTPAGGHLLRLRRRIAWLRSQSQTVPWTLLREVDRYVILQSEEIEQRRRDHRRWLEYRREEHLEIRARYAEAKVLIDARRQELADLLTTLRQLAADLQLVEEKRLRAELPAFPADDPVHASARKYFQTMVAGRQAALRFRDARTSRYGSLLNQKWTVPRKHLLTAISKARKRLAVAETEAAKVPEEAPAAGD